MFAHLILAHQNSISQKDHASFDTYLQKRLTLLSLERDIKELQSVLENVSLSESQKRAYVSRLVRLEEIIKKKKIGP